MFARTRVIPVYSKDHKIVEDEDDEDHDAQRAAKPPGKVAVLVKRLPGWSHMPLLGLLTVIILLACMLPM